MRLAKVEPQVCPVVSDNPGAEGALYNVPQAAVVGVVLDVGGHGDLVVCLDVVSESDEVVVVGEAYGAVISAGPL